MSQLDALSAKIDTLQTGIDAMARGFMLITGTLETHSEMLSKILQACAVEPEGSELAETLERIADALERQNGALASIGKSLDHIGPGIEIAVMRGVARAVGADGADDEDGNDGVDLD